MGCVLSQLACLNQQNVWANCITLGKFWKYDINSSDSPSFLRDLMGLYIYSIGTSTSEVPWLRWLGDCWATVGHTCIYIYYVCVYSRPCLDNPAYDLRFVDPIMHHLPIVTFWLWNSGSCLPWIKPREFETSMCMIQQSTVHGALLTVASVSMPATIHIHF